MLIIWICLAAAIRVEARRPRVEELFTVDSSCTYDHDVERLFSEADNLVCAP